MNKSYSFCGKKFAESFLIIFIFYVVFDRWMGLEGWGCLSSVVFGFYESLDKSPSS